MPNISCIFDIIDSIGKLINSVTINHGKSSLMLEGLIDAEDYENILVLVNKLIIRERKTKTSKNPRLAYLYYTKAEALMNKNNREYEKALEALEKAKKYSKKLTEYYYSRAAYAYIAEDYVNGLTYVNEALLNKTNGQNYELKGLIYHALHNYEESKEFFIKALEYNDCNREGVYRYLAEDYYALGKHKEALHYINQALMINQDTKSYYAKANILEALGRIKESQEYFKKYNELSKMEENL